MHSDKQTSDSALARTCTLAMALAAGFVRLVPFHPMNFTPVAGLALFGGARLRSWLAYVMPLAIMAVTDVLLWLIHGSKPFNPWVYGCFLLTVVWGRLLLRNGGTSRIVAVSVLASAQFFLVTNFGVWLAAGVDPATLPQGSAVVWQDIPGLPAAVPIAYARNLSGLLACYAAALPFVGTNAPPLGFLGNQLIGDLFYTGLLFGIYAWLRSGVLLPRHLREPAAARMS